MKKVLFISVIVAGIVGCSSVKKEAPAQPTPQVVEAPIATLEHDEPAKAAEFKPAWPADWQPKVFFGFDEDQIDLYTARALGGVMVVLAYNQDINVSVEGHADRIGSAEYNQKLSERRAEAVKRFLVEHGVAESRIHAHGHGQENTAKCDGMRGRELIACLQPDRNVELRSE